MTPTAFTIGNHHSYDSALRRGDSPRKLGVRKDYEGGWVWRTEAEAQAFIDSTELSFPAKVYGLLLPSGWSEDVSVKPGEDGVHRLLNDAQLVSLEFNPERLELE